LIHSIRPERAVSVPAGATTEGALVLLDSLLGRLADLVVERLLEHATSDPSGSQDEWLDTRAAADYLGVHRDTLRKLAAERSIPTHQEAPGCKLYFRRDELDEWRRSGRAPRTSATRLRAVS
jgi:excisionase family DNA binding protein